MTQARWSRIVVPLVLSALVLRAPGSGSETT